ncbi:hypothetical protein ACHAW6_012690 [Cyclotella cf. meneghiniana]
MLIMVHMNTAFRASKDGIGINWTVCLGLTKRN